MAKSMTAKKKSMTAKKRTTAVKKLRAWTKDEVKSLKTHSKKRTPVAKISKQMKRTERAVRQKAVNLGIGLGHRR